MRSKLKDEIGYMREGEFRISFDVFNNEIWRGENFAGLIEVIRLRRGEYPTNCKSCKSLNSFAATCGLCLRSTSPGFRTIIFFICPSGCSVSSAVTCAETPPFNAHARSSLLEVQSFEQLGQTSCLLSSTAISLNQTAGCGVILI